MKLEIRDLRVRFGDRLAASVEELDVDGGEIVGLAGESGSGKSMTVLAVLGLAGTAGASVTGSVRLDGRELVGLPAAELRAIRGRRIAATADGGDAAGRIRFYQHYSRQDSPGLIARNRRGAAYACVRWYWLRSASWVMAQ